MRKARDLGVLPRLEPLPSTGQRVAVVGAGPAGLGAASVLAKAGPAVHVLDPRRLEGRGGGCQQALLLANCFFQARTSGGRERRQHG